MPELEQFLAERYREAFGRIRPEHGASSSSIRE